MKTDGSSSTLHQANFAAFKFAGSSVVQFRAMVTPCVPRCEPVTCSGDAEGDTSTSPRRIRRSTNLTRVEAGEEEEGRVVVANILTIVERPEDRARPAPAPAPAPAPLHPRPQSLVTLAAVCVVFSLLLLAQCAVILLCARHRRVESSNTGL